MLLFMKRTALFLNISFPMLHSYKLLASELLKNISNLLRNLNIFAITNYYYPIGPLGMRFFFYIQPEIKKTVPYGWTKTVIAGREESQ